MTNNFVDISHVKKIKKGRYRTSRASLQHRVNQRTSKPNKSDSRCSRLNNAERKSSHSSLMRVKILSYKSNGRRVAVAAAAAATAFKVRPYRQTAKKGKEGWQREKKLQRATAISYRLAAAAAASAAAALIVR